MQSQIIIQQLKSGEPGAFKELVESYRQMVFNTALNFLQNREWAEDISQEVFIEVFQSVSKFNENSSLSTWIYRITVNKCLDAIRHTKRQKRFAFLTQLFNPLTGEVLHDISHSEHPGVLAENREQASFLFAAINQLADKQKSAFILSQVEELPQKEIAAIMNISEKAVESLIQRAKANLRQKLGNIYDKRRK